MSTTSPHPLQFEVKRLISGPVKFDFDVPLAIFDIEDDSEFRFQKNIKGTIQAVAAGGDAVLVTTTMETTVKSSCIRCLEEINIPIKVRVQQAWFTETDADKRDGERDEEKLYFDGNVLDPAESLREEIMILLPSFPRCSAKDNQECFEAGKGDARWTSSSEPIEEVVDSDDNQGENSWAAQLGSIKDKIGKSGKNI